MNIRAGTILTVVALAAAAAPLGSRAAPPETAHQKEMSRWFELERQRGSANFAPVLFPPPPAPAVASNVPPKVTVQTARVGWWEEERQLDDGYASPAPRTRGSTASRGTDRRANATVSQ